MEKTTTMWLESQAAEMSFVQSVSGHSLSLGQDIWEQLQLKMLPHELAQYKQSEGQMEPSILNESQWKSM